MKCINCIINDSCKNEMKEHNVLLCADFKGHKEIKSCSTCKDSAWNYYYDYEGVDKIGFTVVNKGCKDCRNYNKWKFDGLSAEERFEQERND